jgi:hypothetical protein
MMKLSNDYNSFLEKLDVIHPRYGETIPMALAVGDQQGL